MSQQRYIYPPLTLDSIEALYNDPQTADGFSTIVASINKKSLLYDRAVSDTLTLPYDSYQVNIKPNELVTSASIYNIIDRLHDNFLYLNTQAIIASNVLPGNYTGYYYVDPLAGIDEFSGKFTGYKFQTQGTLPVISNNPAELEQNIIAPVDRGGSAGNQSPVLFGSPDGSGINNHPELNTLKAGTFIRDESIIRATGDVQTSTTDSTVPPVNYHLGFVASSDTLTVLKMTYNHKNDDPADYIPIGSPAPPALAWEPLNSYQLVQDLPGTSTEADIKNTAKYTNIHMVKSDNNKHVYILDRGFSTPGISQVSNDSRRSVLYKYDMTGFLSPDYSNTEHPNPDLIQSVRRELLMSLGDSNRSANVSDMIDPVAFTVRDNGEIILYDEYDYTFKRYDSIGNYLGKNPKRSVFFRGSPGTRKKYIGISDIHFDEDTKKLYVLCPNGNIFTFTEDFELVDTIYIQPKDSNQSTQTTNHDLEQEYYTDLTSIGNENNEEFVQLEFSKNESNVYYVLTSNRVIKRFKSRPGYSIGNYDFLNNDLGSSVTSPGRSGYRVRPLFMSATLEARVKYKAYTNDDGDTTYTVDTDRTYMFDNIYMYCGFMPIGDNAARTLTDTNGTNVRSLLSFKERVNYRSCLIQDDYDIYEITDTTSITHKEYTSDVVYNKLIHKLLANHTKMVELINYRLQSLYTQGGEMIFDRRVYLREEEYRDMILDITDDYYVGINEYLSTGVLNRCFSNIHKLQQSIINILQMTTGNTWPLKTNRVPVEPYLHTDGTEYIDIENRPYTGYYYIREQTGGSQTIAGRTPEDGTQQRGAPTTDRYLTPIS